MNTVPELKNHIRKCLFYTEERTDNTKKSLTPPPTFSKRGYIYTYFIVHKIAYAVFIIKSKHFVLVFHYESNPFIFYIRTKVLAMETVHRVRDCPRDAKEWQKASNRLNCSDDANTPKNKYHCLPAANLSTLLEFCYNKTRYQVVKGTCTIHNQQWGIFYSLKKKKKD